MTVTLVALIYVHQQVELVKLSYVLDSKGKKLKDMLDRKESLGYNIANLEDPTRLEKILLAKKIDISFPKRANVVKVASASKRMRLKESFRTAAIERKGNISGILEFFGFRAEAHARENRQAY
jgi:hypothetical protein